MADRVTLQAITQGIFVLLFLFTLAAFVRQRDRARLEVAGLFGSVAIIIFLQAFTAVTGIASGDATFAATLLLLSQPYLLLRLVAHFRPLPPVLHALGLACMAGSWVPIILARGGRLGSAETLVVVALFASVEASASVAFVRAAVTSQGVIKRRLVAVAVGSGLLALTLLSAAVMTGIPGSSPAIQVVSDLLALGSAAAYYVGFAPPAWLRRAWQMAELRQFLIRRAELGPEERLVGAEGDPARAIRQSLGARASVLALAHGDSDIFELSASSEILAALEAAGVSQVKRGPDAPIMTACWRDGQSVAVSPSAGWGDAEARLAGVLGGRAWLVSPLQAHGGRLGALVSVFDTASPFLTDELSLSDMLAAQAAMVIEGSRLYVAAQRSARQRAALLDLSQTLADESSVQAIAQRLVEHLGEILPTTSWGILLPAGDGALEIVAAGGAEAERRQGHRVPNGAGVTGRALRLAQPIVVGDVHREADYVPLLPHIQSELALPLRHGQQTIGVLNFEADELDFFTPERVDLAKIIAADVSLALARAQALERLAESEARHRLIIDGALDAVVTMSSEGLITGWNRQSEAMFGWTEQEALGQPVATTIIPARHRAAHEEGLRRYRLTGSAPVLNQRLELAAVTRDGREFPVDLAITAVERGGSVSFTAFIRDISQRKRAEEQLQEALARLEAQNAELEAASQLKSEFLANMSHELRTPLNAILGFSELLLDAPEDEAPEVRTEFLTTIHDSGEHLLALINDVLDLSKVEAGRMELHFTTFEVQELVQRVVETVRPLASRKSIALDAALGMAGGLVADFGRVKQILYNLLSNAIKFTPDGGRVQVEAQVDEQTVLLIVSDTGIGIAPEDHERIFLEFQQVDSSADRRYEGTGLGLALTKRIVELHGGRMWLESALGQGSRFFVELPRQPAGLSPERALPTPASSDVRAERVPGDDVRPLVLVVEDDARAANLLRMYLARGGYRAVVAQSGADAIDQARTLNPIAITLDILLPELDGWEVLRQLKSDASTRDVPVVVVSVVDDQQLGYALGAADYFVKPVDRHALLARLARYTFTTKVKERPVRVLAVDDDPAALRLMAGILEPLGFTVSTAQGGAEGIALALRDVPDLVLVDLMMPDVNGFDVIDALKAQAATRDVPILVVSAKDITAADKARLNGHVAAIFQKGSTLRVDLLSWLEDTRRRTPALQGDAQ